MAISSNVGLISHRLAAIARNCLRGYLKSMIAC